MQGNERSRRLATSLSLTSPRTRHEVAGSGVHGTVARAAAQWIPGHGALSLRSMRLSGMTDGGGGAALPHRIDRRLQPMLRFDHFGGVEGEVFAVAAGDHLHADR